MKLAVVTPIGHPIQSDELRDEIIGRVLMRLHAMATRGGVETAIRDAFRELEDELRAKTVHLGPEHDAR